MKILIIIFFFEIKESKITRGHNYTLVKKQSRLDVRKYSFSQRTINVWNNLSARIERRQRETVEQRTRTQVSRTREREGQKRERRCVLGLRQE